MQNKKYITNNRKLILVAVILFFVVGGGIFSYFCNKEDNTSAPSISKEENKKEFSSENETPATPAPIPAPPEVWKTYASAELGFSIKYPKMVYGIYKCSPKKPFYVPLKVFENSENGIVYITEEYYYKAKYDSKLNEYIGPCEKIINSIESLNKQMMTNDKIDFTQNPFLTRVFVVKNIKNDIELNKFVKDNYGPECFVKDKTLLNQNKIYEINIDEKGNIEEGINPKCPLNYVFKVLYAPEKNKVMSVKLGQECGFGTEYISEELYKCYDDEMINNFKFE